MQKASHKPIKEPIDVPKWKSRTEETNEKHTLQLKTDRYNQTEILLLGDSMLERWLTTGSRLWELYEVESSLHCFNAGIGGDGVQNVLWRLESTAFGNVLSNLEKLHSVALLIGTNNIEKYSAEQVSDAIKVLVTKLYQMRLDVQFYVISIIPRIDPKDINKKIISCNQLLEKWINETERVQFVNIYPLFCDENNQEQCKKELFDDHVHLNQQGYSTWMKSHFFEFLKLVLKKN